MFVSSFYSSNNPFKICICIVGLWFKPRTTDTRRLNPYFFAAQKSQINIWDVDFICITETPDGCWQLGQKYLKCQRIYLSNLSAQARKFWISMKKRLHGTSVVCDLTMDQNCITTYQNIYILPTLSNKMVKL